MTFPKRLNKRLIKSIPKINSCDSMNIPFIIHHCSGNIIDFISHTIQITINWTTIQNIFKSVTITKKNSYRTEGNDKIIDLQKTKHLKETIER